jgi:hypothetical protein
MNVLSRGILVEARGFTGARALQELCPDCGVRLLQLACPIRIGANIGMGRFRALPQPRGLPIFRRSWSRIAPCAHVTEVALPDGAFQMPSDHLTVDVQIVLVSQPILDLNEGETLRIIRRRRDQPISELAFFLVQHPSTLPGFWFLCSLCLSTRRAIVRSSPSNVKELLETLTTLST